MTRDNAYLTGFAPYALAAFLVGIVGGLSTTLGPAFVRDLGIDYSNTTWTALAQAISTAACAPILGRLGDAIGRRRTLLLGIGVFLLGNLISALAGSLAVMLLARFVLGVGSAAIAPVILAYIVSEFPREKVAGGFSGYMLISSASVIFGPAISGVVVAAYGWRALMVLCTAISAAVLLLCALLPTKRTVPAAQAGGFDTPGAVLTVAFFGLLLCVPSFGQNIGWTSGAFIAVLAAALLSLTGLVWVERRARQPVLPGDFIARRTFVLCVLALFLTQGLMQANMTNTIVFVNHTQPGSSTVAGYAISVMYVGMSLGAILVGPQADRREPRNVLTGSLLITAAGSALMLLYGMYTPQVLLMGALGLLGFGLGGNATIFMKVALAGVPAQRAGAATGAYGLFRDLAAPFGVAVFVPLFTNGVTGRMAMGMQEAAAAVSAMRALAIAEVACIAAGIVVVRMLPRMKKGPA